MKKILKKKWFLQYYEHTLQLKFILSWHHTHWPDITKTHYSTKCVFMTAEKSPLWTHCHCGTMACHFN